MNSKFKREFEGTRKQKCTVFFFWIIHNTINQPIVEDLHSSSKDASSRRRTNPTATPTRTRPGIMAAILKISATALQVEVRAPPLLPCDGCFNELTIFAKDCSVQTGRPNEATLLWALSPSNEFNPLTYLTVVLLWGDRPGLTTVAGTVAGDIVADAVAIGWLDQKKSFGEKMRAELWGNCDVVV